MNTVLQMSEGRRSIYIGWSEGIGNQEGSKVPRQITGSAFDNQKLQVWRSFELAHQLLLKHITHRPCSTQSPQSLPGLLDQYLCLDMNQSNPSLDLNDLMLLWKLIPCWFQCDQADLGHRYCGRKKLKPKFMTHNTTYEFQLWWTEERKRGSGGDGEMNDERVDLSQMSGRRTD